MFLASIIVFQVGLSMCEMSLMGMTEIKAHVDHYYKRTPTINIMQVKIKKVFK